MILEIDDLCALRFKTKIHVAATKIIFTHKINKDRPVGMDENTSNGGKVIQLNFDEVEVGKTAVKTIELWNESCVSIGLRFVTDSYKTNIFA